MKKHYVFVIVAALMLFVGKVNAQISMHAGYQNLGMTDGLFSLKGNGFYVGVVGNNVKNDFGVATGVLFSCAYNHNQFFDASIMYLRIPILANYGIDINNDIRLYGFAGPKAGFSLKWMKDKDAYLFDLGLMFGCGLKRDKLSFEIGYNIGLFNEAKVMMNHFVAGIGYTFYTF